MGCVGCGVVGVASGAVGVWSWAVPEGGGDESGRAVAAAVGGSVSSEVTRTSPDDGGEDELLNENGSNG